MKQVKSTAISVFALVLAFMWLAPLVWLVGTAFSEPTFHMTFFPNKPFYLWEFVLCMECHSLCPVLSEYADTGGGDLLRTVCHIHSGCLCAGCHGF